MTLGLFDVPGPLAVVGHGVDAQADDLAVALVEFGLQAGHVAQFRGAHRSKILRVRKQDRPPVADPLVKVDRSLRGFGREIGGRYRLSVDDIVMFSLERQYIRPAAENGVHCFHFFHHMSARLYPPA